MAEPVTDEESGPESGAETTAATGDRETSLDLLELDPVAALDTSRHLSADELAAMSPTMEEGEEGEVGDEIARRPPPSRWGRIDLGLAWRREIEWTTPRVDDQLWVVVTWRR
ncbi:MAG TPA: hypothetical protein VIU61_31045 [Kofleriaceae bacterium]